VIEYILLFSLGFLTAALSALLIAPAIRGRIVHFTEARIRATTPISATELRAQSDMLKASYAAENAKLGQAVRHEREKSVVSEIKVERLTGELRDERQRLAQLSDYALELESDLRVLTSKFDVSQAELAAANGTLGEKAAALTVSEARIAELMRQVEHLGSLLDTDKIDIAVRDTEYEGIRLALNALKTERDNIREELRSAEERARIAESRLRVDENKIVHLQNRLDQELAQNADRADTAVEQEPRDVRSLNDRIKAVRVASLEKARTEHEVGETEDPARPANGNAGAETGKEETIMVDQGQLDETIRADAMAVSGMLTAAGSPQDDETLREGIASIAARMIALTALREGKGSPIYKALDVPPGDQPSAPKSRISLADRAARAMSGKDN
jgi:chromosome segregation ATPase